MTRSGATSATVALRAAALTALTAAAIVLWERLAAPGELDRVLGLVAALAQTSPSAVQALTIVGLLEVARRADRPAAIATRLAAVMVGLCLALVPLHLLIHRAIVHGDHGGGRELFDQLEVSDLIIGWTRGVAAIAGALALVYAGRRDRWVQFLALPLLAITAIALPVPPLARALFRTPDAWSSFALLSAAAVALPLSIAAVAARLVSAPPATEARPSADGPQLLGSAVLLRVLAAGGAVVLTILAFMMRAPGVSADAQYAGWVLTIIATAGMVAGLARMARDDASPALFAAIAVLTAAANLAAYELVQSQSVDGCVTMMEGPPLLLRTAAAPWTSSVVYAAGLLLAAAAVARHRPRFPSGAPVSTVVGAAVVHAVCTIPAIALAALADGPDDEKQLAAYLLVHTTVPVLFLLPGQLMVAVACRRIAARVRRGGVLPVAVAR